MGAGTTNRTRDLLITSLCNDLYKCKRLPNPNC